MVQEKLCQFSKFGWSIAEYIYILHKIPRKGTWESFMEQFLGITTNVQELILNKLHGYTKTWRIQIKMFIIDAFKLKKYQNMVILQHGLLCTLFISCDYLQFL
jgi:hypothetical protein